MVGSPVLVILWLGWSGNYKNVPWWVPGLSTILIGLAITLVFVSFVTWPIATLRCSSSPIQFTEVHVYHSTRLRRRPHLVPSRTVHLIHNLRKVEQVTFHLLPPGAVGLVGSEEWDYKREREGSAGGQAKMGSTRNGTRKKVGL